MGQFLLKTIVSALLIAGASGLARRSSLAGALLVSLPLTSLLAILWLWRDTRDPSRIAAFAAGIGWLVLPSLLLPLWDSEMGKGFIATLRSLLAGSDVAMVRSFLQDVITAEVGARVDDPPGTGRVRVQFVASQLVGVVMARYILELEPFKSLPVDQVAETIAPNLQRYLTGDLPGLG